MGYFVTVHYFLLSKNNIICDFFFIRNQLYCSFSHKKSIFTVEGEGAGAGVGVDEGVMVKTVTPLYKQDSSLRI
jgi:hypothetical protein